MALALRAMPGLRCWVHLDERAGAFFALGSAKAGRRPAAILATSGTAAVNFGPAVTEARYGRVPLLLLTADRPPELQGRGSPQTIDQVELFGRHAKWFFQLPLPEATAASETHVRDVVTRALVHAVAAPSGPVHLNLPFREPLLPQGSLAGEPIEVTVPGSEPPPVDPAELQRASAVMASARRGLIVCGPLDEPGFAVAVSRLAAVSGFPVLADGLSNVRSGAHDRSHVIAHHDALLRAQTVLRRARPDMVLRFGATPTSKVLDRFLGSLSGVQLLVDDGGGWERPPEPTLISAPPVALAQALADVLTPVTTTSAWLAWWRAAGAAAAEALATWRAQRREVFEGAVFERLSAGVPDGAIVLVGNSMPVRDLDTFLAGSQREIRFLGNRGANGIDGLVATALGAAATQARPLLAVVGDLSFLHDLNALVAARRLGISATIVLLNNDGGGIFSFLPQATAELPDAGLPAHYEELFGTPHGIEFGPLVAALGAHYVAAGEADLQATVGASMQRPGIGVVELRTDRARNVALHHEAHAAVAQAVEALA